MKKNKKQIQSVQNWIPIDAFFNNGIVKIKNNKYLKIIKIIPINYSLKSELEKKSILNSYKVFLKTFFFIINIIIDINIEDLSIDINYIYNLIILEKKKNNNIVNYSKKYIDFINKKNKEKNSSSKNFYILIDSQNNLENKENLIIQDLNDKYLKIKDNLIRCGNKVEEIKQKEELIKIYFSFFNVKKYLEKKEE